MGIDGDVTRSWVYLIRKYKKLWNIMILLFDFKVQNVVFINEKWYPVSDDKFFGMLICIFKNFLFNFSNFLNVKLSLTLIQSSKIVIINSFL